MEGGEITDAQWQRIAYGSVTPFALLQSRKNSMDSSHYSKDWLMKLLGVKYVIRLRFKCGLLLSCWPTFPQIFINGEFIGGSDIILNMHQFSKATGRIKEAISGLPVASENEDMEESVALKEESGVPSIDGHTNEEEPNPFGLDALITNSKDDSSQGNYQFLVRLCCN